MLFNFLRLSAFFLIVAGILASLGLFAFKILSKSNINENLIVLGPDVNEVYNVSKKPEGYEVTNLDIDILNNKKALIVDEKLRPLPVKPELLPIESINNKKESLVIEEINKENKVKVKVKVKVKNNTIQKKRNNKIKKNSANDLIGDYRVQFGSFRDLNKAKAAINDMKKKHIKLLGNIKLEIYSYKNNDNLIFHRVWTSLLPKKNGLELCDQFRLISIICILQVNN